MSGRVSHGWMGTKSCHLWGSLAVGVMLAATMAPLPAWTGCFSIQADGDAVVAIQAVTGGFGLSVTLANLGPGDATDVSWYIGIQGALWPSGAASGTVTLLPAGESTVVRGPFFLGLGPAQVMVRAGGDLRHGACQLLGPFTLEVDMVQGREESIPPDAVKGTPDNDHFPPVVHDPAYRQPVPLPGPVNTAGAEDACFITLDGSQFYFFFTPDVSVPAQQQLLDGVTGIWWTRQQGGTWTEPERILLNHDLALDGAPFVEGSQMWFASFRVGNYGQDGDMWTAEYVDGQWTRWRNAGELLNGDYNIGEMHLTPDGTLYFHREEGGYGGLDLWTTTLVNGTWTEPVNMGPTVNSVYDDSRPWVSPDGTQLWFTRPSGAGYVGPAVFRSLKVNGAWTPPEEVISNFAGEPTLDAQGNVYFVHHFFSPDMEMLEADIYVAYRV